MKNDTAKEPNSEKSELNSSTASNPGTQNSSTASNPDTQNSSVASNPDTLNSSVASSLDTHQVKPNDNTTTEPGLKPDIVLASSSPRRKELLEKAGVVFQVHVSEVDEALDADTLAQPEEAAKKLAEKKAGAVVQEILAQDYTGCVVVIGADTMVVHEGEIFGKPRNISDATRMLRRLSDSTHEVITAVSVWMVMAPETEKVSLGFRTFAEKAQVVFEMLSDEEISVYLRCGESFDKAGAYAVQGEGARLIKRIEGDIDTVIGLPVTKLLEQFPDLL